MLNFNPQNYSSPVRDDYTMQVDYTKEGAPVISFPKVDNRKICESNGTADMWMLSSLIKAGIDPKFSISTEGTTALDGYSEFAESAEQIVKAVNPQSNEKTE